VWDNRADAQGSANVMHSMATFSEQAAKGRLDEVTEVVTSSTNRGLAFPYNRALEFAHRHGFELMLILDRDSILRPGAVSLLRHEYRRLQRTLRVGAVAARNLERVEVRISPKHALARLLESFYEREYASKRLLRDSAVKERLALANSGTLVPVGLLRKIGGYNERLFMDAIDYEAGARLRAEGFRLSLVPAAELEHSQGVPFSVHIGPLRLAARTYTSDRSYHLVRDPLRAARIVYPLDFKFAIGIVCSMSIGCLGALILLPDRRERGRQILRGLSRGLVEPKENRGSGSDRESPRVS
jgi:rhamnosyltransferase